MFRSLLFADWLQIIWLLLASSQFSIYISLALSPLLTACISDLSRKHHCHRAIFFLSWVIFLSCFLLSYIIVSISIITIATCFFFLHNLSLIYLIQFLFILSKAFQILSNISNSIADMPSWPRPPAPPQGPSRTILPVPLTCNDLLLNSSTVLHKLEKLLGP